LLVVIILLMWSAMSLGAVWWMLPISRFRLMAL
jgi:hypothetical protein